MSRSASDVTVVSVNWNGRAHLQQLVPSVLALAPGEFIVVDNGSSDGSQDFLKSFAPRVRLLQNPCNQGFAHPCNLGAEAASRPVVAFINNDMRTHPKWLSAALPGLAPETPCVASRILDWEGKRIDFNGSSLQYLGYALQQDIGELVDSVSSDPYILFPCGGAMLFDREVFLELGGFDSDFFAIFEDVDLGWRTWSAGYKVGFAPDSITFHRGHATFQKRPNAKMRYLMHRNALLTVLKNYEEPLFRRIFPLAVAMGIKRAVHFAGVQREGFYLWEDTERALQLEDPRVQERVLDSLNHLVALEDVLDLLPSILAKRQQIQELRKRSDKEILSLFRDPLRPIVSDPGYIQDEARWLELLDLTRWLQPAASQPGPNPKFEAQTARLRQELNAQLWLQGRSLVNPSAPPAKTFFNRIRSVWRMGLSASWRRLTERVNRGI